MDSDGNQTATESSGHFSERDNLNQGEIMAAESNTVVGVGSSLDPTNVAKDIKNEVSSELVLEIGN